MNNEYALSIMHDPLLPAALAQGQKWIMDNAYSLFTIHYPFRSPRRAEGRNE